MINNNCYKITQIEQNTPTEIQAEISLDKQHPIFKGHFPNMPVLPGVCMIKMVKDTINQTYEEAYQISQASNIKFLVALNPEEVSALQLKIKIKEKTTEHLKIDSQLFNEEHTFFKFRATMSI